MAERFKALTRNPSSSLLLAGHAGVNSLLASLPASYKMALKSLLWGAVFRKYIYKFSFSNGRALKTSESSDAYFHSKGVHASFA